jgi:outer membrane protein TolC
MKIGKEKPWIPKFPKIGNGKRIGKAAPSLKIFFSILFIPWLILGGTCLGWGAQSKKIESVVVTKSGEGLVLIIESDEPLDYVTTQSADPPTLQIYFIEKVSASKKELETINQSILETIQYHYSEDLLESMVLNFSKKFEFTISQKAWILSIDIQPAQEQWRPLPQQAAQSLGAPSTIDLPNMTLPPNPNETDFVKVGLANDFDLEIAKKELILAKKRLFEANRSFFPALSGLLAETSGASRDVSDPTIQTSFTRREIGLELGQPLFQSGKIYYYKKQTQAQKEIAELEIIRIMSEKTFEIYQNLYTYLHLKDSFKLREQLDHEIANIVETTRKKKEIGLASESEYLGAQSAGVQVHYELISHEKELEVAEANLKASLHIEEIPKENSVRITEPPTKMTITNFSLKEWSVRALGNRPEMKVAQLNSKMKLYAKNVARADNLLQINASGFVGQTGSAFTNETLTMRDSYNFGVEAVLYFGGSSIKPFLSREKTAPDLGSNDRSETNSQSVTLGVLDSLDTRSDYYEAQVEADKANRDLRKTKREILLDLREAYYNYQKAKVQLVAAHKELRFRKKQARIAETKDKLHQIEATELIQAMINENEAQVNLIEATAYSIISIFAMEKATASKLIQ